MEGNIPLPQYQSLFDQAIQVLSNQVYDPESEIYKPVVEILSVIDFFEKTIKAPIRLPDFIQLAKFYLNYEVKTYGEVLLKETETADKLQIILRGKVQKLQQRPYSEVEEEVQAKREEKAKISDQNNPNNTEHFQIPGPNTSSFCPLVNKIAFQKKRSSTQITLKVPETQEQFTLRSGTSKNLKAAQDTSPMEAKEPLIRSGTTRDLKSLKNSSSSSSKTSLTPKTNSFGSNQSQSLLSKQEPNKGQSLRCSIFSLIEPVSPIIPIGNSSKTPSNKTLDVDEKKSIFQQSSFLGSARFSENFRKSQLKKNYDSGYEIQVHEEDEDVKSYEKIRTKSYEKINADYPTMTNEDVAFIKEIAAKNPGIKRRCFIEDVIRVTKIKVYYPGEYFGENFFRPYQTKENSIFAALSEEVHLLTLSRESYHNIISELNRQRKEKDQIFYEVFPNFGEEVIKRFSRYFTQKGFKKGDVIYHQDEPAQGLYLLRSGDVKLSKTFENPTTILSPKSSGKNGFWGRNKSATNKAEIPLINIIKNQFFGEEILMDKTIRQYTAIANKPNTIVYSLDENVYQTIYKRYQDFFKLMKDQAQEKFSYREQRVLDLCEKQNLTPTRPSTRSTSVSTPHTNNSPKGEHSSVNQDIINLEKSPFKLNIPKNNSFFNSSELEPLSIDNEPFQRLVVNNKLITPKSPSQHTKHSEVYRIKFSHYMKFDPKQLQSNADNSYKKVSLTSRGTKDLGFDITEFNIRKELGEPKESKSKLSNLSLTARNSACDGSPSSATQKATNMTGIPTLFTERGDHERTHTRKGNSIDRVNIHVPLLQLPKRIKTQKVIKENKETPNQEFGPKDQPQKAQSPKYKAPIQVSPRFLSRTNTYKQGKNGFSRGIGDFCSLSSRAVSLERHDGKKIGLEGNL